jgi:WD40 repeat protein
MAELHNGSFEKDWNSKVLLVNIDLMVLKRMTKQKKGVSTSSFIARQTGALCFDFNQKDSNMYLVGTEDGQIHKCSSSYNEQYLNTYSNHTGPVHKVKWSPFLSNVFLSCSSDWTVRLWNQENEDEVFKFQSGKDTINDIAWSPQHSTYFASVSASGRLEIWDLEFSVLDPAINHVVLDRQFTAVQFGLLSPTVLTGDDNGAVTVYKLCRHIGPDEDQTSNGISSPFVTGGYDDEQARQWKQDQSQVLNNVLNSKVHTSVSN